MTSSSAEPDITHQAISSYFIGPRAENLDHFTININTILEELKNTRLEYFKEDNAGGHVEKRFISEEIRNSPEFRRQTARVKAAVKGTAEMLGKHSIPFWSPRYQAHMCTDLNMASMLGYFMTMMYNPNNVALEASPLSTVAEIEVGEQLCDMFGYNNDPAATSQPLGWGHITCGGTVANLESIWAARNLKFYPLSVRKAMDDPAGPLRFVPEDFSVRTCQGRLKPFRKLETWELLNLRSKTILDIPEQLQTRYGITPDFLSKALDPYNIQSSGKDVLERHFGFEDRPGAFYVATTRHYSWPKGAAVQGVGSTNMVGVPVDDAARVDLAELERLLTKALDEQRPVYAVVAVIGSTEEGAVDPLRNILSLRQRFQGKGLSFLVHADAAWGGYFATMLPRGPSSVLYPPNLSGGGGGGGLAGRDAGVEGFVPDLPLRVETQEHLFAMRYCDSITVDPHKAGYIPYPAGALAYRDGRIRFLVTWLAPYLSGGSAASIGVYGVEGSKPGAAPVGAWLAHQTIGLNEGGYGALLAEACWTSARLSALWAAMSTPTDSFICVPFNLLPSEQAGGDAATVEAEKQRIRDEVLTKSNAEIFDADSDRPADEKTMTLLRALGSDTNINAFALNWRYADTGELNTDVAEANYLMQRVVKRLSVDDPEDDPTKIPLYLTSTQFEPELYGSCGETFKRRLGLAEAPHASLMVLRNVVMSPFATDHDFINTLGKIFREVVEDEVKISRARNDDSPDHHSFWVHGDGSGDLFLSYRPMFNIAKHRRQVILGVRFDDAGLLAYQAVRGNTEDDLVLKTAQPIRLQDLLSAASRSSSFVANLTTASNGIVHPKVEVQITSIVKNRPLDSTTYDESYPSGLTPFYLYGTGTERHMDHILTRAPNIALSAGNVTLTFPNESDTAKIDDAIQTGGGVIVTLEGVHEAALQPFGADNVALAASRTFFFREGASFQPVCFWADPRSPTEGAAGLVEEVLQGTPLATGTLTLGDAGDVLFDVEKINRDPFAEPPEEKVSRWRKEFGKIGEDIARAKAVGSSS